MEHMAVKCPYQRGGSEPPISLSYLFPIRAGQDHDSAWLSSGRYRELRQWHVWAANFLRRVGRCDRWPLLQVGDNSDRKFIRNYFPFYTKHTLYDQADYRVQKTIHGLRCRSRPQASQCSTPRAQSIKNGSVVFVESLCEWMAKFHLNVSKDAIYDIVTFTGDDGLCNKPINRCTWKAVLASNVRFVFANNACDNMHSKIKPVPLGVQDNLEPQSSNVFNGSLLKYADTLRAALDLPKTNLVYMNFNKRTNLKIRKKVYDEVKKSFKGTGSLTVGGRSLERNAKIDKYYTDLGNHKFVVAPEGNGLDCHRLWEALLVGTIPVTLTSQLQSMHEGLPILALNNWSSLTQQLLKETWPGFKRSAWSFEKLWAPYWIKKLM